MVSALTVPMLMAVVLVSTLVCGHQQGSENEPGEKHGSPTGQQPGGKGSSQSDRSGAARALNQNYGGGGGAAGGGNLDRSGAQRGSSNQKYGGGDGDSQDGSGRYVARIYTDPEYYGYESIFPGGRANFKAYRSEHGNERSGQDQSGGRNSQEQGRKSPGGTHGQQQQQQQRY